MFQVKASNARIQFDYNVPQCWFLMLPYNTNFSYIYLFASLCFWRKYLKTLYFFEIRIIKHINLNMLTKAKAKFSTIILQANKGLIGTKSPQFTGFTKSV